MTSRTKLARIVAVLLITALSLPGVALADAQKAAEYYEQATQAYQDGDLEKAADFLNKAYAEDPDLVYQYNRILALEGLGRYEEALQVAAALEAPMKADPQNRFEDISEVRAKLEAEVEKKRRAEEERQQQTEVTETTETQTETELTEPPEVEESGSNAGGIALVAGGGVLVGSGLLFLTGTLLKDAPAKCYGQRGVTQVEQTQECILYAVANGDTTAEQGYDAAKGVVRTHQIAGLSLLGAGAIAAGIGAYLIFAGGGESAAVDADGGTRLAIAPWYFGDGAGAVLDLRF